MGGCKSSNRGIRRGTLLSFVLQEMGREEANISMVFFYSNNLYLSQVRMPGARPGGEPVDRGRKEQAMEGVGQLMMVGRIL